MSNAHNAYNRAVGVHDNDGWICRCKCCKAASIDQGNSYRQPDQSTISSWLPEVSTTYGERLLLFKQLVKAGLLRRTPDTHEGGSEEGLPLSADTPRYLSPPPLLFDRNALPPPSQEETQRMRAGQLTDFQLPPPPQESQARRPRELSAVSQQGIPTLPRRGPSRPPPSRPSGAGLSHRIVLPPFTITRRTVAFPWTNASSPSTPLKFRPPSLPDAGRCTPRTPHR